MHRFATSALVALLVAACAGQGSPSPSTAAIATSAPTPTARPSATPRPTPTLDPTPAVTEDPCPTTSPISIEDLHLDECNRSGGVDVRAWIDKPDGGIGFECCDFIRPAWLYLPDFAWALWNRQPGPDQDCAGLEPCTSLFVNVHPDAGFELGGPARWVIVTGHTNDPASASCHWVSDPPREFTEEEDAAAREHCAGSFVITAIRDAP
jgi:hypothetical protein